MIKTYPTEYKEAFSKMGDMLRQREFDAVIEYMLIVYIGANERKENPSILKSAGYLLQAYYAKGDYSKAYYYGSVILNLLATAQIDPDTDVHMFMAASYYELKAYEKALEHCLKIIEDPTLITQYEEIQAYLNLVLIHTDIGKYDRAYDYLSTLSDLIMRLEEPAEIVIFYYNTLASELASKTGKVSQALSYLNLAKELDLFKNVEEERMAYFMAEGIYYETIKNYEESTKSYIIGYGLARKYDHIVYQRDFLECIHQSPEGVLNRQDRDAYFDVYQKVCQQFEAISKDIDVYNLGQSMKDHHYNKSLQEDGQTGVKNRIFIEAYIGEYIGSTQLSCGLFTIDGIQNIMKKEGVDKGNQLIMNLAGLAQRIIGSLGLLGRLDDERFIVAIKDVSFEAAQQKMQQLVDFISLTSPNNRGGRHLTISAGVANNIIHERYQVKSLIERADRFLMLASKEGGNGLWLEIPIRK